MDPTGSVPEWAFVDEMIDGEPDWNDGSWEAGGPPYIARILIGEGGVVLEPGFYQVWAKFDLGSETPTRFLDVLEIQDTESADLASSGNLSRLRARLGERKADDDADGSNTMFTDSDLADMLSTFDNDINLATVEGWERKAGELSRLINVAESGSERPLQQKFKNAQAMLTYWQKANVAALSMRGAALGRITGKPINLREPQCAPQLYPWGPTTDSIRLYPTHRLLLPAVLG